jgi:hypothetical protein
MHTFLVNQIRLVSHVLNYFFPIVSWYVFLSKYLSLAMKYVSSFALLIYDKNLDAFGLWSTFEF